MLTQMDVRGVMACTHDHAPLSKRISPLFPPAVHKCTLSLPILSEGRSLEKFLGRSAENVEFVGIAA